MSSIVVRQTRTNITERELVVDAVAVDASGKKIAAWGDMNRLVAPRSCIKPFHAVVICENLEQLGQKLSIERLVLTAGSQGGRPDQVTVLLEWLKEIGVEEKDLTCGVHPATDKTTRRRLIRDAEEFLPIHHNSAGKHIALLALCRVQGWPIIGYTEPSHNAQKLLWRGSAPFFSLSQEGGALVHDGCGCPTPVLTLQTLALGAARLADPGKVPEIDVSTTRRVWSAMASHPAFLTRSDEYFVPRIVEASDGDFIIKEGSYGICFLSHRPSGIGIAFKIRDGSEGEVPVVAIALLRTLGFLEYEAYVKVKELAEPKVLGSSGSVCGSIQVEVL